MTNEATAGVIFEQYEFRGWLITIESSYRIPNELVGFAIPTKYSHILDCYNYIHSDDIADEYGIPFTLDADGLKDYGTFDYLVYEPDDMVKVGINSKDSSCILSNIVKDIIVRIDRDKLRYDNSDLYQSQNELIIVKQINKKSIIPKAGKRKSGFLSLAWATLVKLRDGKCLKCGSLYDLHAHHVKSYKSYPELRYVVDNGETLCGKCHRQYHYEHGKN